MADDLGHNALYDVSIDVLNLSDSTISLLESVGVTSIGDCVDHFDRGVDAIIEGPDGFMFFRAMEEEVKPKLQALGYWPMDEQ